MISYKDIKELEKNAKARRTQGLFVAEGIKMVSEAPADLVEAVFMSESFARDHADLAGRLSASLVPDGRFSSLSDTKSPQGILAVLKKRTWSEEDLMGQIPFLVVLENLQDPGNAGTILRTAEAAGVTGLLMTPTCVDLTNPKVIRSTMGSVYRMPVMTLEETEILALLKRRQITSYASSLQAEGSYLEGDYRKPTAFFIGNESRGLSEEFQKAADRRIRIPMAGRIESLNAAMAAGILMYEAARQRQE